MEYSSQRILVDDARQVRSSKYSADLKKLDGPDLIQVIDYAVLMGEHLRIEYGGSLGVKSGIYAVNPKAKTRGALASLEGEDVRTGVLKKFMLDRIIRIAVIPE